MQREAGALRNKARESPKREGSTGKHRKTWKVHLHKGLILFWSLKVQI